MKKTLLIIWICLTIIKFGWAQVPSTNSSINIEKVILDFKNALNQEKSKTPSLYQNISAVKINLASLENLIRKELIPIKDLHIDYIPQSMMPQQTINETAVHDSIERYQRHIRDFLLKEEYDLIGWEASALDTVTQELFKQELLRSWIEADSTLIINGTNVVEKFVSMNMWQDGVLAYWALHGKGRVMGIQERSTWKLNHKANQVDIPFSASVATFRSYLAMAKMIKAIKGSKASKPIHAVIVMNVWHQSDFTSIAQSLGIKMNVINLSIK